jgi:hypothetical protein
MSSTQQLQRRPRRLVPTIVIVLGLLLISAVMIQQVVAQDSGSLKPPFKLNRTGSAPSFQLQGTAALPLSAPIIMSGLSAAPIRLSAESARLARVLCQRRYHQYTWGRVTTAPLPDTVWSVGRNPTGFPLLNPATGTYTKGMQALLIYGPLDLSDYTQLIMTGTYRLDTAPGDYFGMAYSTDGTNWNELYAHGAADPGLTQPHTFYAILNQVARKPVVWIA